MAHRFHNEIRASLHGDCVLTCTEYWTQGNKRNTHIWVVLIANPALKAETDIRETYQTKKQAVRAYEKWDNLLQSKSVVASF